MTDVLAATANPGVVPDGFQCFSIEELGEVLNHRRVPLSALERSKRQGRYPYYGASGVVDHIDAYLFDGEHVLISEDGENLRTRKTPVAFKARGRFWVNNHAHIVKCRNTTLADLLIYHFSSLDLNAFISGAAQPKLNKANLLSISLLLPKDDKEQQQMAAALRSLDDKIDLLQRQNQTLEAMTETLFRGWFGDDAGADWPEGTVEDLFVLQRGYDLPTQDRVDGPHPVVTSSGLSAGHIEFKVKAPGVATGRSGLIGKVFLVQEDFWPLNTSLYVKEFKRGTPMFAYLFLKTMDLPAFNAGSAVPTLNRNHVHAQTVRLPPRELIERFESTVEPLFRKVHRNGAQISSLEKLRDNLLPKLMTGEVRVAC